MRNLVLLLLCSLMLPLSAMAQTENKLTSEELDAYFKQYPFMLYRGKLFSAESEFAWPEGFQRMDGSKLTPYQAWVSHMPLWHYMKGVATLGEGIAFEAEEISRSIHLPWRTTKFYEYAIPLQMQLEYLMVEKRADNWKILPKAGDTMSYARWLVSSPVYDSRQRLVLRTGELRLPDSLEYNRFFNLVAENTNYLSLESNCDTVTENDLRPGDLLVARTEIGTTGRVYVIMIVVENAQGEKRYLVGTGGNPPCDFYIPLFHNDQTNPWLILDEVKGLPPEKFGFKGFFRLRLPK